MKLYTIISTFNPDERLITQLESIFYSATSFGVEMNVIVRDDGSTSQESLKLLRNIRFNRVYIHYCQNVGLPGAFFEAMKLIPKDGDYYFFADQDDVWLESKVERTISSLEKSQEDISLYVSKTELVDDNLKKLGESRNLPDLVTYRHSIVANVATGCTMCANRSLFLLVCSNIPNYNKIHMHDWWFYIVASFLGNVIIDNTPTVMYRQHSKNAVGMKGTIISRLKVRVLRVLNSDSKYTKIKSQALEFFNIYKETLSCSQKILLTSIASINQGIIKRFRFVMSSNVKANSRIDSFIIKVLILFGLIK